LLYIKLYSKKRDSLSSSATTSKTSIRKDAIHLCLGTVWLLLNGVLHSFWYGYTFTYSYLFVLQHRPRRR